MDANIRLLPSQEDIDVLQHLSALLHLFNHRNRNQHRRSIWWRHFSTFRRHFNRILHDIETLIEAPSTHLERIRLKARAPQLRESVQQHAKVWQNVLVPRWQRAFSQTVAHGRFAPLGLVLLAVLSQTCRILHITSNLEDMTQAEIEKVLSNFAHDYWEPKGGPAPAVNSTQQGVTLESGREFEDFGTAVSRGRDHSDHTDSPLTKNESPDSSVTTSANTRKTRIYQTKPRAMRKKKDTIDELFSGL